MRSHSQNPADTKQHEFGENGERQPRVNCAKTEKRLSSKVEQEAEGKCAATSKTQPIQSRASSDRRKRRTLAEGPWRGNRELARRQGRAGSRGKMLARTTAIATGANRTQGWARTVWLNRTAAHAKPISVQRTVRRGRHNTREGKYIGAHCPLLTLPTLQTLSVCRYSVAEYIYIYIYTVWKSEA